MSYAWKLRHESSEFEVLENQKFTGFASASEESLALQNKKFLETDLIEFIKPYVNSISNVNVKKENTCSTIVICAVELCEKGMYFRSKELKFNYSNYYKSLPNEPENWRDVYIEAEELAKFLGIKRN